MLVGNSLLLLLAMLYHLQYNIFGREVCSLPDRKTPAEGSFLEMQD